MKLRAQMVLKKLMLTLFKLFFCFFFIFSSYNLKPAISKEYIECNNYNSLNSRQYVNYMPIRSIDININEYKSWQINNLRILKILQIEVILIIYLLVFTSDINSSTNYNMINGEKVIKINSLDYKDINKYQALKEKKTREALIKKKRLAELRNDPRY